jgi:hypothetical protein
VEVLSGRMTGAAWREALAERFDQVAWVLEHEADLDADFLAIYGMDLAAYDITGPRDLALAHRLPAYQGVMAARVEEEREDSSAGGGAAPVVEEYQPRGAGRDQSEISLTAFRVQFPGLVSMATSGEEG